MAAIIADDRGMCAEPLDRRRTRGRFAAMMSRSACIVLLAAFIALSLAACRTSPPGAWAEGRVSGTFTRGAVAADHPLASEAGAEILRQGGNAIDAAVATSFALSVVRPYSCGIGGGGFMVIFIPPPEESNASPRRIVLNYRETAPRAVEGNYYVNLDDDEASRFGVHAVGVPGTVAGLLHALDNYGTLDRETVLAPAIRLAEDGFAADAHHIWAMHHLKSLIDERPERAANFREMWEVLFKRGRMREGEIIRNPLQARALRMIAEQGAAAFYHGPIADAIVHVMQREGGPITHTDLAGYSVDVTAPLRGHFQGHELLTMPPPSSGGIAQLQILGMIEQRIADFEFPAHNSPAYVHLLAEAMQHAFADRAEWLADTVFVDVPIDRLISVEYLDELAARIDPEQTLDDPYAYGTVTPAEDEHRAQFGLGGTSHFSVIDANGMAVACTETINLICGSLVEVPGFGFLLNNEMDDFTTIPGAPNAFGLRQSDRNLPAPGKRPLSSMSPTILVKDDRAVMIAGASGGPRIITGTHQVMLNVLLFEMEPERAVRMPRFHHQWMPRRISFEDRWNPHELREQLEQMGHATATIETVGMVQIIHIDDDGTIRAASDPRKGGRPAGY
jgi:gamma-glutamyltranspeptidase / glutathione hydrolase